MDVNQTLDSLVEAIMIQANGKTMKGVDRASEQWPYVWYWRSKLGDRNGQVCRVLVHGRANSVLVEFPDGRRVVTSRWAVRKRR